MEMVFDKRIPEPKLWSPGHPDLYNVEVFLSEKDSNAEELVQSTFGIRSAACKDSLLIINSDTLDARILIIEHPADICNHSDDEMLDLLDQGNYNAILTIDPLPARLMDLFDRRGIISLIKREDTGTTRFNSDINRPCVVWVK